MYGGAGQDSLWGDNEEANLAGASHGSDYLDGGDGDDVLIGGGAGDILVGGDGADELQGDAGNGLLAGEFHGNDLLAGGGGNDRLFGMGHDDALSGGTGGDTLFGDGSLTDVDAAFPGNDYLNGDEGNDVLVGGGGNDVLDGGAGNDFLSGEDQLSTSATSTLAGDDMLYGGEGDDTLLGGNGGNVLSGDEGNDALWGGDGDDLLMGGDGDDFLRSGDGEDTLDGGAGNDFYYVKLGSGAKHIQEGAGDGTDWNVLVLEGGFNFSMVRLSLGSLVIGTGDAASDIHLDGVDYDDLAGTSPIDEVRFSDGSSMTVSQLIDAVPIDMAATEDVDYLRGTSGEEVIHALAGDDVVEGRGGDDLLDLGTGNDLAYGGDGNDTVTGGDGHDVALGDAGADQLSGGLGDDLLFGGSGNDVLRGEDGADQLTGDDGADQLLGGAGADQLSGGGGNDLLDGGSGADSLAGGAGDDTYLVNDAGDLVVEAAGEGRDQVRSTLSLTLAEQVEDLLLEEGSGARTGTGNGLDNALTGNAEDNSLSGLAGADTLAGGGGQDTLDGGTGSDAMSGGLGDDLYLVDASSDSVIEQAGEGRDTVIASADFTLGDQVEVLTLTGAAVHGTGNAQDNTLTGTALDNLLDGQGGNDLLQGSAGNDQLLGGSGDDTLVGGSGDDVYEVDSIGDLVIEQAGEGLDTLRSSASQTLGENVEHLELTGAYSIDGTGNALDNRLTGNAGSNRLDGGAGADTLVGGEGDDTYVLDSLADVVIEQADQGRDTVEVGFSYTAGQHIENVRLTGSADLNATGDDGDNQLQGNAGRNVLDGGAGQDTLAGGAGDDTYVVDSEGDWIVEAAGEGTDTVVRSFDTYYVLTDGVENLTLTGSVVRGNGNDLDNLILGNDADNNLLGLGGHDTLVGGAGDDALFGSEGADSLVGGAGDDYYEIDEAGDTIVENANEGDDFIQSAVSWALGANLERLALVGGDDLSATGNALANGLWGNAGANTLTGGQGNDFLAGGTGDDVYVFNRGDGQDSIDNTDTLDATDTLRFGAGISDNDVLAFQSNGHLFFKLKGSSDQISFIDHYAGTTVSDGLTLDHQIDRVEFANGVVWDQAMIQTVVDRANNNHAPTVNSYLPTLNAKAGSAFSYTVPLNTITDPDAWDSITYSITLQDGSAVPAWLHFDAATRTMWGTPDTANVGTLQFVLWGTDNYNYSTGQYVTLKVGAANRAPVVNAALADKAAAQGAPLAFTLPATSFTDADGDALTYSATLANGSALPGWLSFNASTRTFSGTPPSAGSVSVKVTATDGSSASASDVFDIVVTLQNLVLTGTANADTLTGGSGDDTYGIDSASDVIVEAAGEGVDSVQSAVAYTLGANVENLLLTGTTGLTGTGNELNNQLTGTSGNDRLTGLAGDDTLDGGAGNDSLLGGTGNDTYVVNATTDVITENANEGTDSVQATVTWTLGSNLENLLLGGTSTLSGTGNTLNNLLTGNSANNTLTGLAGNDTLDGGAGNDTLVGGAGDDTYVVNVTTDVVTENASEGTDTVQSAVTWTLGNNLENLTLTGSNAINGTGNALANTLIGNGGANVLTGAAGDDIYDGGAGNDTFTDAVTTSSDTYRWGIGAGLDTLTDAGGSLDHVDLAAGIVKSQLKFVRNSNDLELSITGQSDKLTVKNWYAGSTNQIEEFRLSDGTKVLASEVQGLLGAMAAFTAPDGGTVDPQQRPLLEAPLLHVRDGIRAYLY